MMVCFGIREISSRIRCYNDMSGGITGAVCGSVAAVCAEMAGASSFHSE